MGQPEIGSASGTLDATITIENNNTDADGYITVKNVDANDFVGSECTGVVSARVEASKTVVLDEPIRALTAGMVVTGTNVTANTVVTEGREFSIESECTDFEKAILKLSKKAVRPIGKIIFSIDEATKIVTRSFEGLLNFNVGQADALEGDTDVSFFAFGPQKIKQMTGWDVKISNLKAELTPMTAVTNAATSSANNFELVVARGIMEDHTTVSSINLTERVVTGLTSYNEASNGHSRGTVGFTGTASLESGEVVNINGSGQEVVITGDIEVIGCDAKIGETQIQIDLSRFITAAVTTS